MKWLLAFAVFPVLPLAAAGSRYEPYKPDGETLHLWHLDESGPPFHDEGRSPALLWGLVEGADPGRPSLEGMGGSVSFEWSKEHDTTPARPYGPILLSKPELDFGDGDNIDAPFPVMGDDGAFTMEAIVKLDILPSQTPGYAADVVTMDDDLNDHRVFLFRIEKPGFLSFVPISGDAVRGGGLATIPTTGPNAINTNDWFHVAVTYDGNERVSHNLKLYWTRIRPGLKQANLIGSGTLSADLRRELGDFAIGNTGKYNSYGPFEFFPGCLDEVRISGIARKPNDFFFIDPASRKTVSAGPVGGPEKPAPADLMLRSVAVDDVPAAHLNQPLVIGPGSHRLDFDFGFPAGVAADPFAVKCRLDGLDDEWKPTARGMTLTWEMLDGEGQVIATTVFSAVRSSPGWESDVLDSKMERRIEPLFVPEGTRRIRVTMSSGTPDTTGCWMIDDLALTRSARPDANLWANGDFGEGERTDQITGIPTGWSRGGSEPAIARLMQAEAPALGLLDAEQDHSGYWACVQDLKTRPRRGGETFLLGWSETYNVISGSSMRATYQNVPSGKYTFRAIAVSGSPATHTSHFTFPVVIRQPFWKQTWFLPLVVSTVIMLVGLGLFLNYRRRARHRYAVMQLANAVERDRARIARDLHDDLGTRVSLMKHAASVVRQAIDGEPARARGQVARLESAAADLVRSMEGLVWAVNPKNDSLEHLAGHLSGVAQEIFRDAPVTLRISIPTDLPAIQLRSDFRHHFSLAVKEALHNILKHAGPCEATLKLGAEGSSLVATISDTGAGFDPESPRAGNGLLNLRARAREMRGSCEILASPGKGTRVVLRCPLPNVPMPLPT